MQKPQHYQRLTGHKLLAAYLFASWHVRHMPTATAEDRLQRATWCRDYCGVFAGRWYGLGAIAWFVQVSPLGGVLSPAGFPFLGAFFLVAFAIGVCHTVWQVRAQEKAGPPSIEPPLDTSELRRPTRHRKLRRSTAAPARPAAQPRQDQENAPPDERRPPESR